MWKNIEAVREMRQIPNQPKGFEEIEESLGDKDRLKNAMERSGITSITHSEGITVWDHTKRCLAEMKKLDVAPEVDEDIRHRDLRKTEGIGFPWNRGKTGDRIKKGKLLLAKNIIDAIELT